MIDPSTESASSGDTPLTNFSNCHSDIISHLDVFNEIPSATRSAAKAEKIAQDTLEFFRKTVFDHHAEEERDLFPAVLDNAQAGEERNTAQSMIDRLKSDHRAIEALWATVEPGLVKLSKGHIVEIGDEPVAQLVSQYKAHAKMEESDFLPLAEKILGRNDAKMADLGLALHTRHVFRAARRGLKGS